MTAQEIVRSYSDETLAGIVRDLSESCQWPQRLEAARAELNRRNRNRRGKAESIPF